MAGIRLLLLSTFFFFQGICGYCIYNMLTDGSSFKIVQAKSCAPSGRIFHRHMEMDTTFCCPYDNKDCSCNLRNDERVGFYIFFYFEKGYPSVKIANCTTGGALSIHGTQDMYIAECVDANGVSTKVPIVDAAKPEFYY